MHPILERTLERGAAGYRATPFERKCFNCSNYMALLTLNVGLLYFTIVTLSEDAESTLGIVAAVATSFFTCCVWGGVLIKYCCDRPRQYAQIA